MDKYLIGANWKMNLSLQEAKDLALYLRTLPVNYKKVELIIYCSHMHIAPVHEILVDTPIKVGGQNIHYETKGPYTGETSGQMLREANCFSVLLAHSERRHYFNEEYNATNRKIKIALNEGLHILLCVGESAEEKLNNVSELAVIDQLISAFDGLARDCLPHLAIAYEPIWAIGTGKVVRADEVTKMQVVIRRTLAKIFDKACAEKISVLYGGSVNADNINSFIRAKNINGLLIGSASIKKESFYKLLAKGNFFK